MLTPPCMVLCLTIIGKAPINKGSSRRTNNRKTREGLYRTQIKKSRKIVLMCRSITILRFLSQSNRIPNNNTRVFLITLLGNRQINKKIIAFKIPNDDCPSTRVNRFRSVGDRVTQVSLLSRQLHQVCSLDQCQQYLASFNLSNSSNCRVIPNRSTKKSTSSI